MDLILGQALAVVYCCQILRKRTLACKTSTTCNPPSLAHHLHRITMNAMNFCGGCPGYRGHAGPITSPRSRGKLTGRKVPNPQPVAIPLPPSLSSLCPPSSPSSDVGGGLSPPVLPPSLSSLYPPPVLLPALLAAAHLASLPSAVGHGQGHLACLPLYLHLALVSQPCPV